MALNGSKKSRPSNEGRENLSPNKSECLIDVKAWGYEDPNRTGWIKINKTIVVDCKQNAENTTRGLHIVTLKTDAGNITVDQIVLFDLWKNKANAEKFTKFIQGLPNGTYVIGASADEVSKNLASCREAFASLGVPSTKITYRGSIAFIAIVGMPYKTLNEIADRHKGPVMLSKLIVAKDNEVTDGYIASLQGWGFEDKNRIGFIKLNERTIIDISQSPDSSDYHGLHLVVIEQNDVNSYDVQNLESHRFNLCAEEPQAVTDLVNFLNDLPPGCIVLGASAEDVYDVPGFELVVKALLDNLHLEGLGQLKKNNSLVFIAKKGDPSYGKLKWAKMLKGPVSLQMPLLGATVKTTDQDVGLLSLLTNETLLSAKSKLKSQSNREVKVYLDRGKLFDQFEVNDYYPLDRIKDLFTARTGVVGRIDFTGVDQLTDMFFCTVKYIHQNNIFAKKLSNVSLQACVHVTDQGIKWMVETFPNLSSVNIVGCKNVTEAGLSYIMTNCQEVETIVARATNIGLVHFNEPERFAALKVQGSPMVSPGPLAYDNAEGRAIMAQNVYFKNLKTEENEYEHFKGIIVHVSETSLSVLEYLTSNGQSSSHRKPVSFAQNIKYSEKLSFNFVECSEDMLDMFACDRALYMLVYDADKSVDFNKKAVVELLVSIYSKVPTAVIHIVGVSQGKVSGPNENFKMEIIAEVEQVAKNFKQEILKINNLINVEQKSPTFSEQQIHSRLNATSEALISVLGRRSMSKHLTFGDTVSLVDPKSYEKLKESILESTEKIHTLHPWYQYMPQDLIEIFEKVPVSPGVHEESAVIDQWMETCRGYSNDAGPFRKCLELLHKFGKLVYLPNRDCGRRGSGVVITDVAWFTNALHQLLQTTNFDKNEGHVAALVKDTPLANVNKSLGTTDNQLRLKKMLEELNMMVEFKTDSGESYGVCGTDLLPKVPIAVEHYMDLKASEDILMLTYQYNIPHSIPPSLVTKIFMHFASIHTPNVISSKELIIQESPACLHLKFIEKTLHKGIEGCCFTLTTQIFSAGDKKINARFEFMLWNHIEMYNYAMCYMLYKSHVYHSKEVTLNGSSFDVQAPDKLTPLPGNHTRKSLDTNVCNDCLMNLDSISKLRNDCNELNPIFGHQCGLVFNKNQVQVKGNWYNTNPTPNLTMPVTCHLNSHELAEMSVVILVGIELMLELKWLEGTSSVGCLVNLASQSVKDFGESEEEKFLEGQVFRRGDTVSVRIQTTKVQGIQELQVLRNGKVVYKREISENHVSVKIITNAQINFLIDLGLAPGRGTAGGTWAKDMRLEAVDRLNPSLVCCATVADFKPESDEMLIHFDGWTSRYDYWTTPDSPDLHPIGFMRQRAAHHRNFNSRLQEPKGYGKMFDWDSYLVEVKSPPVPFELFNEKQTEGIDPFELKSETVNFLAKNANFSISFPRCKGSKKRVQSIQADIQSNVRDIVDDFLKEDTSESALGVIMPSRLNAEVLTYPTVKAARNWKDMKMYYLCLASANSMSDMHMIDGPGATMSDFAFPVVKKIAPLLMVLHMVVTDKKTFLPKSVKHLIDGVQDWNLEKVHDKVRELLKIFTQTYYVVANEDPEIDNAEVDVEDMALVYKDIWEKAVGTDDITSNFVKRFTNEEEEIKKYGKKLFPYICKAHANCVQEEKQLKELDLNQFGNYSNLVTVLNFNGNDIVCLPEEFFTFFPELKELYLNDNKLASLPNGMGNCKTFTVLEIARNQCTVLPTDLKDASSSLKRLEISENPFNNIPDEVYKCTNLETLKANHIKLTSLHEDIGDLEHLTTLEIGGCALKSLPKNLEKLTKLVALDISGVPWIDTHDSNKTLLTRKAFDEYVQVYPVVAALPKAELKMLFTSSDSKGKGTLDSSDIPSLNAQLFQKFDRLGDEGTMNVEGAGIPPSIFNLKSLKRLNLSFQNIKKTPEQFQQLAKLEELILSHNPQMESLCGELALLKKLTTLQLRGCPSLKTPPKEIVSRGFTAVFGYLRRLQLGSVECKRTKLMLVGLGGAGKTSLVQAMCKNVNTYYGDSGEHITDGIDITTYKIGKQQNEITFSVWDFAGQSVYYNTHQFFLSNRAVYLLTWNIRLGYEHAGLDFWLSSVACHAPKAPILVVGTHFDQVKKYWIPEEDLKRRYPQIVGFHAVSAYDGSNIPQLRKNLQEVALKEKYMGERIPEAWLSLEKTMIQKKQSKMNTLTWEEVEECAVSSGIYEHQEINQAVGFLHDLGSVQHFQNEYLKKQVVINPQWIVDAMSCVVSVQNTPIKEGKLMHSDLPQIWSTYAEKQRIWLLKLTEKFDLTFPLRDEPANIVPCLLPDDEPSIPWPDVSTITGYRENMMLYIFDYLPAGLFNRAQVRLHQFSDSAVIWKKGSLLRKNGHLALMTHRKKSQVEVKVQGPRPENILFMVHEVYEGLIAESFHGVTYDFHVPCQDCIKSGNSEPCMFPNTRIRRATELKAPFLQCDAYFHTLPLTELHAMVPPDNSNDFDVHLERSLRDLKDMREDMTYDVFMVYATTDIPQNGEEEKKVAPRKLYEDLDNNGFKVWFPMDPSQIIMEQVSVTMKEAKMVLFCISDNFVADEHYVNIFYYAKNSLQKDIQLVVLGSTFNWKETEMGMLVSTEVFVNMMDPKRYQHKIKELVDSIKTKLRGQVDEVQVKEHKPPCFISYCWTNSADAIKKGSKKSDGCLGWGDPRQIRDFLEDNGIPCWIDVDRVGQGSLFEDIAKGLKHAKVVVCCVSDEYAKSRNCQMEFRFAAVALKLPIVIVVVGTGYQWEATEIGMLSLGNTKLNFQFENPTGHRRLLEAVRMFIPEDFEANDQSAPGTPTLPQDNKEMAFQELLELAERKFLRQVSNYAEETDSTPYPRLFVLDLLTDDEKLELATSYYEEQKKKLEEEKKKEEEEQEKEFEEFNRQREKARLEEQGDENKEAETIKNEERPSSSRQSMRPTSAKSQTVSDVNKPSEISSRKPGLKRRITKQLQLSFDQIHETVELATILKNLEHEYCIRILCEHEEGWHYHSEFLLLDPMSSVEWNEWLNDISPFMARVLAILKHTSLNLPILNTPRGDEIRRLLEDRCGLESEFKNVYMDLRKQVASADKKRAMGNLNRCLLTSGKIIWMCPDHIAKDGSVTVLSEDDIDLSDILLQENSLMAEKLKTKSKNEPDMTKPVVQQGATAAKEKAPAAPTNQPQSETKISHREQPPQVSTAQIDEVIGEQKLENKTRKPSAEPKRPTLTTKSSSTSASATKEKTKQNFDSKIKSQGKLKGAAAAAAMAAGQEKGSRACVLM